MIVEAGAGSGKTALMSGRIALSCLLASPRGNRGRQFTELAASELLERVGDVVARFSTARSRRIAACAPARMSPLQGANLAEAEVRLDELV